MKVQSVDRAFEILELLSKNTDGLSLSEVSRLLKLPTSTVYRLITVLRNKNYLEKKEPAGTYRLGMGLVELTSLYLGSLELSTEAHPLLQQLCQTTGQVVFMGMEQEGEVVYIDKCIPYNDYRQYCILGTRMPLSCTSLGKALLMGRDNAEIQEIYRSRSLPVLTKKSHTKVETLIEDIKKSRVRGYSIDDEENTPGQYCVGAPVRDYRNKCIAAISVSWVLNSSETINRKQNIDNLRKAALEISRKMGYLG